MCSWRLIPVFKIWVLVFKTTFSDFDTVSVDWHVCMYVFQVSSGLRSSSTLFHLDLFSSVLLPNMSIPEISVMQVVHEPYLKKYLPNGFLFHKWYSPGNLVSGFVNCSACWSRTETQLSFDEDKAPMMAIYEFWHIKITMFYVSF